MEGALKRVPLVNLEDFTKGTPAERERFVATYGESLRWFGFVRVDGHGVDDALVQRNYDLFRKFFELDLPAKRRCEVDRAGQRGYVGFGKEHAKDQALADLKEFWHVGRELPREHPLASVYPANVWPAELPELKSTALALFGSLERCANVLLEALAAYFRIEPDSFRHMTRDGNSILRAIHYPPLAPHHDPRAVRAAAHEDINIITLLCGATATGLELLTRDGEWLAVDGLPGQIVTDAGDMLARVTNEVIPSTTHRVVNPGDSANSSRFSLPFFVHPAPDVVLDCLPCCDTKDNPRRYPPVTGQAFLEQRLREIGLLKPS
ncbi:MAG: isopenicillin N synthase family oxygenase [Candidatus Wallbacteria bacterium]|nr:isopenicillin N synthase family oxygenase [Candidatus Wallbacteria bacterium]